MKDQKYTFMADSVRVNGRRQTDGSFSVIFEVGEYMVDNVAELIKIPRDENLKVTIEIIK